MLDVITPLVVIFSSLLEGPSLDMLCRLLLNSCMNDINFSILLCLLKILCGLDHLCQDPQQTISLETCIFDCSLEWYFFQIISLDLKLFKFLIAPKLILKCNLCIDSSITYIFLESTIHFNNLFIPELNSPVYSHN